MTLKNTIKNIAKIGGLVYMVNFVYYTGKGAYLELSRGFRYPNYQQLIYKQERLQEEKDMISDLEDEVNKYYGLGITSKILVILKEKEEDISNKIHLKDDEIEKLLSNNHKIRDYIESIRNARIKAIIPFYGLLNEK